MQPKLISSTYQQDTGGLLKFIFLFVFVSVCLPWCIPGSLLNSTTYHIKQDGTGNFISIQEGIDASTDSDTVLVYPGTYFENIDYLEKSITVASLYIITPEDSLINQTIIDGNQESRCVTIEDCEDISLIGFTIQNGKIFGGGWTSGSGGGILIDNVALSLISNCKIKHNTANSSGGLFIFDSNVELSGNIISNNRAIEIAGGLGFTGNITSIQFSETELNSIFLNYAATGSDIYIGWNIQGIIDIIVDTLTVNDPDYFFICPPPQCTISQQNAKIDEIDQDLYLSPYGNDSNSGLSPEEPLQTLAWAQTLIKRNDENPHTIFLEEGTYSNSLNNQLFPLNIKKGVTYKGVSPDETIIDAESEFPFFFQYSRPQGEFSTLVLEDISLINGKCINDILSGGISIYQADLHLDNVIIDNCIGDWAGTIQTSNGYVDLNNVIIRDNYGQCAVSTVIEYNCPNPVGDVRITNSKIINNHPRIDPDFPGGGAFKIGGHFDIPGEYYAEFINCEISGNHNATNTQYTGLGGASVMYINDQIEVDIINCTIGDNTLSYSTGSSFQVDNNSEVNIYNTILYDNDGYSFNLVQDVDVNIYNSLIEDGDDNVNYYYPLAVVNWMNGNLDEDPNWIVTGENPYALTGNSPCIDAGTLDLPEGIELPEYDLAGNPRIYGGTIDMGAYEWQGTGITNNQLPIINTQITNYPNPFNPETKIVFNLPEESKGELTIYNIKGQRVKTFIVTLSGVEELGKNKSANPRPSPTLRMTQAGSRQHSVIWDGTDQNNNPVSSGIYMYQLKADGKVIASRKCLLLK